MSTFIKLFTTTCFVSLGFFNISFGQFAHVNTATKSGVTEAPVKKPVAKESTVSSAAMLKFATLFPDATNENWSTNATNGYVSFLNNGRKANASFSAKGKLSYLITECKMEHLPIAFRQSIRSNYSNFQLYYASEIKSNGIVVYEAILESTSNFVTLRFNEDGVEEIKTVIK